jgi:hypothetical protein
MILLMFRELVTKIEDLQLNNKRLVDHNAELSFQVKCQVEKWPNTIMAIFVGERRESIHGEEYFDKWNGREFDIREFKLCVCGVTCLQGLTLGAHYWHNRFVSNFLPRVKRIIEHWSFKTTSPFSYYSLSRLKICLCPAFVVSCLNAKLKLSIKPKTKRKTF